MTDKIKTEKYKKLETYLEQTVRNNAPTIFKQIEEAKGKDVMLVLESSDMKIVKENAKIGDMSEALQLIGSIVKYSAMMGVEVRVAPDNSLEKEEK